VPVSASEKLTIETPEQIALEFPLASAGSRFLALAIDTLLQIGGFAVLGLLALGASLLRIDLASVLGTWALAAIVILAFVLYYGYFAVFEALWNGQTPGKRAIRVRVMTTSGRPITPYDALLRNLLRIVDQMPGIYTVGLLALFFTDRNQRLGDLAADTVVVHEQPMERHDHDPARRRPPAGRRGASRLSAQEIIVVETFLSRRASLPEPLRISTARTLAARVRDRLEIAPEPTVDDERLLEDVASEFRGGG
jgi:uncharacterized RDD family membrane protein YckC